MINFYVISGRYNKELEVTKREYDLFNVDDEGELAFQGTRFQSFHRPQDVNIFYKKKDD